MEYDAILAQVLALLQQEQRLSYRVLKRRFQLDEDLLEDLKEDLIYAKKLAADEDGRVLVWTAKPATAAGPVSAPAPDPVRAPLTYTPSYLAEKILTSRSALEGERKQVTVLFADLKGSMELLADRDPEEARQLLDPALHVMMEAVHRYEGTVNQVLGDGIMALFGAPVAHEDHAVRACYAALAMQAAMQRYAEEVRRTQGLAVQMRVGLNSGEVVVRAIGNDLHMDYSAVGQTTHFAARMEQLATPGSILLTAATVRLVEGLVARQRPGARARQRGGRARGGLRAAWCDHPTRTTPGRGSPRADALCGAADGAGGPVSGPGAGRSGTGPGRGRRRRSRAWASRACSMNSCARITPRAGGCWRAPRCPTARPRRIFRSSICSSAMPILRSATTRAPSVRN